MCVKCYNSRFFHNLHYSQPCQYHISLILVLCQSFTNRPRSEKTGLRGFRPGPTQTGLYSHRRRLEA